MGYIIFKLGCCNLYFQNAWDEVLMQVQDNLTVRVDNVWEVAAQRDQLPQPAPLQRGFSIWSVLKSAIGKDLTRITLPATINEPLSALQARSLSTLQSL